MPLPVVPSLYVCTKVIMHSVEVHQQNKSGVNYQDEGLKVSKDSWLTRTWSVVSPVWVVKEVIRIEIRSQRHNG